MNCSGCDLPKPIVNVKYHLCPDCNSLRLHSKSLSERQAESVKKFRDKNRIKSNHIVSRSPIRRQTTKEAGVKSSLSTLKNKIRLDAVQNNEYYCQGCGSGQIDLDCSHILSVGQYKHLELVKENIQLMCRKHHDIWESGEIWDQLQLNCFAMNLIWVYRHDQQKFSRYITRIEEFCRFLIPDQDGAKIDLIARNLEIIYAGVEIITKN